MGEGQASGCGMAEQPAQAVAAAPMARESAIAAAALLDLIAVLVFIIQPGYVASSEMTGYAATMILFTLISHRLPWRPMFSLCILIEVAGNAACLFHSGDAIWLSGARFLAGLRAGGLSSLSFTAIGMTKNPDREFGFLTMWILLYGAFGLWFLPSHFAAINLTGFYIAVVVAALVTFGLVRLMPTHGDNQLHVSPDTVTLSALTGC